MTLRVLLLDCCYCPSTVLNHYFWISDAHVRGGSPVVRNKATTLELYVPSYELERRTVSPTAREV